MKLHGSLLCRLSQGTSFSLHGYTLELISLLWG